MQLLIVETRTSTTRHHELGDRPLLAGSGFECDLVLPGDQVASRHFRLEPTADGYRVQDLDTPSGTLLNGKPVARAALGVGDVITLGTYVITLLPAATPAAAPAAPPPPPVAASPVPSVAPAETSRGSGGGRSRGGGVTREPGRPTPPRRAAKGGGGGLFVFLLFAAALVVVGVIFKDAFRTERRDTSSLEEGLETVREHARNCEFVQADHLLTTLLQIHGDHPVDGPKVKATERQVRSQQSRYDRLLAELKEAEAQAGTDEVESAANRLERLARDAADLLPLRERAEKALEDLKKRMPERFLEYQGLLTDARTFADVKGRAEELMREGNFKESLRLCRIVTVRAEEEGDRDALVGRIQAKAREAARPIQQAVDEFVEEGRYFPALNMLDESELKHLEGTDVWFDLLEQADKVEDKIDEDIPAAARPFPRRKHARPRPKETSRAAPDPRPAPAADLAQGAAKPTPPAAGGSVAKASTAAIAPRRFEDLFEEGHARLEAGDFEGAASILAEAREVARGRVQEEEARRFEERAARPAALAAHLALALEGRTLSRPPRLDARDGRQGVFVRAAAGRVWLKGEDEMLEVPVADLAPASVLAMSGRVRLEPDLVLARAWLALACDDEAVLEAALRQLADEPGFKDSLDSLLTFQRGLDEVPPHGFFFEDQRWLTFTEREELLFQRELDAAFARLGGKDAERQEARADLREIAQRDPTRLVEGLDRWAVRLKTEFRRIPERDKLGALRERRLALEQARDRALALIYDEERYFYPYRPPECPPEKARLYPLVQQEVDDLVQGVRDLWGPEDGEGPGPVVALSPSTGELLLRVRELRAIRKELSGWRFEDDPGLLEMLVLPAEVKSVDLRTYALTVEERERLDQDVKVALTNRALAAAGTGAEADEHDQVRITNNYRVMMGRSRLAWNEKLYRASRSHSEWMSRVGRLSHYSDEPGRRTPMDRMRQEGYERPAGENISMGRGGAQVAHEGWTHSSGHHRNLLWRGHREMASATSGRFWTQSFGGGSEFRGNLIGDG